MIERFAALPSLTHFLIGTMLAVHFVLPPRLGMWAFSLFSLPGTVAHELGHWFVALALGAKPSIPNIIPKREGNTWALGSVRVSPNILTRIPIALAPLALLPLGIGYAVAHSDASGVLYLVHIWIASTFIAASLPSRQDWFVAAPAILCAGGVYFALLQLGWI